MGHDQRGLVGNPRAVIQASGIPLIALAMAITGCGADAPSREPLRPGAVGPAVTLAEGEAGGFLWRYVAYPTADGYCDVVELAREPDRTFGGTCAGVQRGLNFVQSSDSGRPTFVTGSVTGEAHRLVIETRFDGVIETNAIQPPEALDLPFDFFVVALPEGSAVVRIIALDAEGAVIHEEDTGLRP